MIIAILNYKIRNWFRDCIIGIRSIVVPMSILVIIAIRIHNTDVAQGEFLELVPGKRIVQRIVFESEDPAFAGAMT